MYAYLRVCTVRKQTQQQCNTNNGSECVSWKTEQEKVKRIGCREGTASSNKTNNGREEESVDKNKKVKNREKGPGKKQNKISKHVQTCTGLVSYDL